MKSADYKFEAKNILEGRWGAGVKLVLGFLGFSFILGLVLGFLPETLASIISAIIEIPMQMGFIISFYKLYNCENVGAFDFVNSSINNFGKAWGITFKTITKLFLPILVLVLAMAFSIVGTINGNVFLLGVLAIVTIADSIYITMKSYYYQLSYIIAAENPEYTGTEAVEKSELMMEGKRWNLFCLHMSFIPLAILCCFTLGIGFLWLIPYMQIATIVFYKNAINNKSSF